MLSEKFQSSARILRDVVDEDDYYLGWVFRNERRYLAEITRGYNGGIPAGEWLRKEGILQPETFEKSDDGILILYFSIPADFHLIIDRINDTGGMQEETAVLLGIRLARLLTAIHNSGHRVGYLGPENVLLAGNGQPYLLAGARGVPDSHFSPPEAVGIEPEDPRSDIYALGLLMFRGIAGTDDKDGQKEAWNNLSEPILELFLQMVDSDVSKRFPNFKILLDTLRSLRTSAPGDDSTDRWIPADSIHRPKRKKQNRSLLISGVLLFAFLLYMLFCHGSPGSQNAMPPIEEGQDTENTTEQVEEIEAIPENIETPEEVPPVIWITSGTGQTDIAEEFRSVNASSFPDVTVCSGGSRRGSKIILRRSLEGDSSGIQDALIAAADELNYIESPMVIQQVDITLLIGNDLRVLLSSDTEVFTPVSPVDTLFIDVANHDCARRDNAASWTRAALDGKSLRIEDEELLIKIIDYRDGDMYTPEIGIPAILESTVFLYDSDVSRYVSAEEQIRSVLLMPNSSHLDSAKEDYPYPDIWVFLGQQDD